MVAEGIASNPAPIRRGILIEPGLLRSGAIVQLATCATEVGLLSLQDLHPITQAARGNPIVVPMSDDGPPGQFTGKIAPDSNRGSLRQGEIADRGSDGIRSATR